jgi:hypothetical protein
MEGLSWEGDERKVFCLVVLGFIEGKRLPLIICQNEEEEERVFYEGRNREAERSKEGKRAKRRKEKAGRGRGRGRERKRKRKRKRKRDRWTLQQGAEIYSSSSTSRSMKYIEDHRRGAKPHVHGAGAARQPHGCVATHVWLMDKLLPRSLRRNPGEDEAEKGK